VRGAKRSDHQAAAIFATGGELGALMARHDWSATPLGPVSGWPPGLVSATSICLQSRFPMIIFWGPGLIQIYNDAYRPILGAKHPVSLGQPARECWAELWDVIGPMLAGVLERGEATFSDDLLLFMDRHDFTEETYFTFSYSPIRDASGAVGGVFCAVVETTERVVGERRLRTLRGLGGRTADAKTAEGACQTAAETLAGNPDDVPFALFYLLDAGGDGTTLVASTGTGPSIDWPFEEVLRTGRSTVVGNGGAPAVVVPITQATTRPAGFLVFGVNPRRPLDEGYRGFFELVTGHVATAITDARAYEAERRRAEALAELDRAKTIFFSNVSHEFRTPLTLLLGPLEEVLAGDVDGKDRERVDVAYRNALRLLKLVNTLLSFSRLEAGRTRAVYEPVDLAAYTVDLAGMFRSAFERGGLALNVDCPQLPEPVHVDPTMWEEIVLNLVSNAFKHTFFGQVDVTLRADDGSAELTVRDTGVGIPPEALPHLFERFHQVPGTRARTYEGSGIGLSLVHELVALHGGTVTVESELGSGSAFTVRIPLGVDHLPVDHLGADAGAPNAVAPAASAYVEDALRWLPEAEPGGDTEADRTAPADSGVVLVADDNADMRAHLKRILSPHWTVRLAPDGDAALRMVRADPPDIVVTDVMMPLLDGFGLLRALRVDPAIRDVPVIVLSARAGQEATVEGLDAGADDYVVKPFTAAELVARVRTHLQTARVRREAVELTRGLANASHALASTLDVDQLVDVLTTLVVPQWADECVVWLREQARGSGEWRSVPRLVAQGGPLASAVRSDPGAAAELLGVPQALATLRPRQALLPGGEPTLTLALHGRGRQTGALTVARHRVAPWRPTDVEYLSDLGRRLGLALDNASRYQAERDVAVTLQRSLLPSELPSVPGVDLAARYQPGGQGASVGGDWYDAFPVPSGGLALAIGDVMGRGVRAAAIMGQLRAALRGYALEDLPPARLLTRLDAFVEASGEPHLSTCLYAVYDPDAAVLRIAGAGHLPPLLIGPDGTSRHTRFPVGLPLGVGSVDDFTYTDHEIPVEPGSLLLFYTDGLIERRQQSIDLGMRALEQATRIEAGFPTADALCDHVLATLGAADNPDDTTLLAALIRR